MCWLLTGLAVIESPLFLIFSKYSIFQLSTFADYSLLEHRSAGVDQTSRSGDQVWYRQLGVRDRKQKG